MWNTRATHRKRADRPNNPPTEEALRRLDQFNEIVGDRYAKRLQRELSRGDQPAEIGLVGHQAPGHGTDLLLPPGGEALTDEPSGSPRLPPSRRNFVLPKDHSADSIRYEIKGPALAARSMGHLAPQ